MMLGSLLSIFRDQPCEECRKTFAVAALTPIVAPNGNLAGFLCQQCGSVQQRGGNDEPTHETLGL